MTVKQIRIERARVRREHPGHEVLPHDARDPDVVRAKALVQGRRSRRRATGRAVALTVALIGALAASVAFSGWAQAAPRAATPLGRTAKFLGVWNYRTPEPKTGLNIAAVSGTGFSEDFPQVGWIDFTQDPDGEVTGRTDQGCTWQFELKSGELQLAFPGQTCFNRVIGSRYQMNRWTVSVTGNTEREYIQATSYLPAGNFNFTLARGARTKVHQNRRQDVARNYAGHWTFVPANSATGVNIETVVRPGGKASPQAVRGSVSIKRTGQNRILARTANGCEWKLEVAGNTAELAGVQTCHLPGNSSQTYSFWAMAVGGGREYAVLSGSNVIDGNRSGFSLATGLLTRS
jgi:hypothetical protein